MWFLNPIPKTPYGGPRDDTDDDNDHKNDSYTAAGAAPGGGIKLIKLFEINLT